MRKVLFLRGLENVKEHTFELQSEFNVSDLNQEELQQAMEYASSSMADLGNILSNCLSDFEPIKK